MLHPWAADILGRPFLFAVKQCCNFRRGELKELE